jgi:hypothetical protein
MAGFVDSPILSSAGIPEDVSATASINLSRRLSPVDFDVDDWSALDVLPSATALAGLEGHSASGAHPGALAGGAWPQNDWHPH